MKKTLKLATIAFVLAAAAACNTISGIGQDVESAGNAVSKTAEEAKDN
jgi:predicted small secreted protein